MTGAASLCLDVTRLVSRVGRGPHTGIDRVEYAWLKGLLARDDPLLGLARTATGFSLLDRVGLEGLKERLDGKTPWGRPDMLARFSRSLGEPRRAAEADLRRLAVASCSRVGLERLLARYLDRGSVYLNLGHSNLDVRALGPLSRHARIAVMLHDVIPLDWPETQRPGTAERFRERIGAVKEIADEIICPSHAVAADIRRHIPAANPIVAPLGVTLAAPGQRPEGMSDPYFACLGTIDMRKNQSLLLDVWDALGPEAPHLLLIGSRGWCDSALTRRLDTLQLNVCEMPDLDDGAVAALVAGSRALLHPSFAEGYGLPVFEAALRGVPVVCSDLPVFRETLADIPIYADPADRYQWISAIKRLTKHDPRVAVPRDRANAHPDRPIWDDHLNLVLSHLWK